MPHKTPVKPEKDQKPAQKVAKLRKPFDLINISLMSLALLLVAATGYVTATTLGGEKQLEAAQLSLNDRLALQKAQLETAPKLPPLSLNQKNERQGADVTVDPAAIGKPNPFN